MEPRSAYALVFYGATGDLAYKKIFPALHGMARSGQLTMPVVGVAKSGWTLDQLRARAFESIERHGGIDRDAFDTLMRSLRYIDGDYGDAETCSHLREILGSSTLPVHYLAIPPKLFGLVFNQLKRSGACQGGRVIIEKPFGHDGRTARELNRLVHDSFNERDVF